MTRPTVSFLKAVSRIWKRKTKARKSLNFGSEKGNICTPYDWKKGRDLGGAGAELEEAGLAVGVGELGLEL